MGGLEPVFNAAVPHTAYQVMYLGHMYIKYLVAQC